LVFPESRTGIGGTLPAVALYDRIGHGYTQLRRPDPRIATQIRAALGDRGPVIDLGAGPGTYEPDDLPVIAVDPAITMLAQRPVASGPAVRGVAEQASFPNDAFGAGMAIFTVHHWADPRRGLAELRRIVRGPVVVLSWDLAYSDEYWLVDEYVPASKRLDRHLPSPDEIANLLGGGSVEVVGVPADCTDGFFAAWWCRPEAYLDPQVRAAMSGLARLGDEEVAPGIAQLARDLESGAWHERHADLLELDVYDAGYRLITAPAK
jgi:SAM-dependent methyltransferase